LIILKSTQSFFVSAERCLIDLL